MSAITPVTTMPANSASPSGMLTTPFPRSACRPRPFLAVSADRHSEERRRRLVSYQNILRLDAGEVGELILKNRFGSTDYHVLPGERWLRRQ